MYREDFPILTEKVHQKPLIYLDNAATTQVPECVVDAMKEHWFHSNANVHRGMHTLSLRSTDAMERARRTVQRFLGAVCPEEVIFTSGTTASINSLANAYSFGILRSGDEVIVTEMEHHSNFVPWQEACKRSGAVFRTAPVTDRGDLDLDALASMLTARTRLVAVTWVSNVLGTINPIRSIIQMAHEKGALVLIDAAQAMRHTVVNVQELDCDYLVFSGHKMMGPTGIGVLYGKRELLESLPPGQFGGGMIQEVYTDRTTYGKLPFRLESGTPNYIGAIGLARALDYLTGIGMEQVAAYESKLLDQTIEILQDMQRVRILGSPEVRSGAVSFVVDGFNPTDTAMLLDSMGVAVRSGHHCAQPLLRRFSLECAVRVSPAFYNTPDEIQLFGKALGRIMSTFFKN